MGIKTFSPAAPPVAGGELTLAALRWQNETFRGRGGISEENRSLGFRPAFYDMQTGVVHPSRFASGLVAPMHVLDGLPDELVACRLDSGRVVAAKSGVVAGFERHGNFYTREQAALTVAQMRDRSSLLSNPDNNRALLAAWERFMVDQDLPDDLLRPVVEHSWSRCHDKQLDPELPGAPLMPDQEVLRERQSELREAAQPILQRAGEMLFRADSLALLADGNGVILDSAGDRATHSRAEALNLAVGGRWAEDAVGTNAIGTALAEEQPVQLYGAEHFCSIVKRWTCSAEVIRDPHDGHVLGVLDISGLTDAYQRQALEFAITGARLIECNLAAAYFRARQRVIEGSADLFRRWGSGGLLAFDRCGRLVKANDLAHVALKLFDAELALTPQTRVAALDLDGPPESVSTPRWLSEQHRHPIVLKGRVIGSVVVLPYAH